MPKKRAFRKRNPHHIRSFSLIVIAAFFLSVGMLWGLLSSLNAAAYRDGLVVLVEKTLGRKIEIKGPVAWDISWQNGLVLSLEDLVIANPPWASRPDMAHISKVYLHLYLPALLKKKMEIVSFDLVQANLHLESKENERANWSFEKKETDVSLSAVKAKETTSSFQENTKKSPSPIKEISFNLKKFTLSESKLWIKTSSGRTHIFDLPNLVYTGGGDGINLHLKGAFSNTPIEVDLTSAGIENLLTQDWDFNVRCLINEIIFDASGQLDYQDKNLEIPSFMAKANDSVINGNLQINFKEKKPSIIGNVHGQTVRLADFSTFPQDKTATPNQPPSSEEPLFSREAIDFSSLKTLNAQINIDFDHLLWGLSSLDEITGALALKDGVFAIEPFKAKIAGSATEVFLQIDAAQILPASLLVVKAPAINLEQIFKLSGIDEILSGQTDLTVNLATKGSSSYEMAAHLNGSLNLLMEAGKISSSQLRSIVNTVLGFLMPKTKDLLDSGINCMAARYEIHNGLLDTKGFLLDTDAVTLMSTGYINLPDERIGMSFHTRPKTLALSSMVPSMRVIGNLRGPQFLIDPTSTFKGFSVLMGLSKDKTNQVPTLLREEGKNSCALTLDNPAMAKVMDGTIDPVLTPTEPTSLKNAVRNIGTNLINGLGQSLLGN